MIRSIIEQMTVHVGVCDQMDRANKDAECGLNVLLLVEYDP